MSNPYKFGEMRRILTDVDTDSTGRPNIEDAVVQFQAVYLKLTTLQRLDLMEVTLKFSDDPQFRLYAKRYGQPLRKPRQPFRFLDLPTELQLHVAGYVLASPDPFTWRWQNVHKPAGGRIGGFNNAFDRTVRLCQVSRQLRSELMPLFWKLNTFVFRGPGLLDISFAYHTAVRHLEPQQLRGMNVQFRLWTGPVHNINNMQNIYNAVQQPATLEKLAPARIQVQLHDWSMIVLGTLHEDRFLFAGRLIKEQLAGFPLDSPARNWRFFPLVRYSKKEQTIQWLEMGGGMQEGIEWIKSGI